MHPQQIYIHTYSRIYKPLVCWRKNSNNSEILLKVTDQKTTKIKIMAKVVQRQCKVDVFLFFGGIVSAVLSYVTFLVLRYFFFFFETRREMFFVGYPWYLLVYGVGFDQNVKTKLHIKEPSVKQSFRNILKVETLKIVNLLLSSL